MSEMSSTDTVIDSQLVQAMEVSSAMVEKVRNDSHGRCLAAEDIRLLKCLENCLDIHMLSCFQVSQSSWHSEFPEGKEHVSRQSTQTRAELRKIAGICQKGGASNCSCSLIAGVWSDATATVEICWMLRHLFQVRSQKPDYCRLVGCLPMSGTVLFVPWPSVIQSDKSDTVPWGLPWNLKPRQSDNERYD